MVPTGDARLVAACSVALVAMRELAIDIEEVSTEIRLGREPLGQLRSMERRLNAVVHVLESEVDSPEPDLDNIRTGLGMGRKVAKGILAGGVAVALLAGSAEGVSSELAERFLSNARAVERVCILESEEGGDDDDAVAPSDGEDEPGQHETFRGWLRGQVSAAGTRIDRLASLSQVSEARIRSILNAEQVAKPSQEEAESLARAFGLIRMIDDKAISNLVDEAVRLSGSRRA